MRQYEKYRISNTDWQGRVPSHWFDTRIKYLATEKSSLFIDGDWIESKVIIEHGIRYITTGNVKTGYYSEQGNGYISEKTFRDLNCTEVYEGDLLISRLNLPIGRACIVPNLNSRIVTSVDNVIFRPNKNVSKLFLLYLFSSKKYFEHTELIARGATMQRISRGILGNIKISIPPLEEQIQIANYLDDKTEQLDALIAKKEQLISLLQEERTAMINQAVTKGLDPNVPMKDSGIEWLGEIPEHWEVTRIKYLTDDVKTGTTPPSNIVEYYEPKEVDWFTPSDFYQLELKNSKRKISKKAIEDGKCKLYPKHSVLLIGIGATLGKVGIISKSASSNQQINSITFNLNKMNPFFGLYYLNSINNIIVSMSSSATLAILNQTQTKDLLIPLTNLDEQEKIVSFIKKESIKAETIISKTQQEIQLLTEYKTALISEVVTGKIDVREEVLVQ